MINRDFPRVIDAYKNSLDGYYPKTTEDIHYITSVWNNIGFANEMCGIYDEALKYYSLSANKNCSFANLNIGFLYDNGLGVEKNTEIASSYYEKGKESLESWQLSREKYKESK